MCSVQNRTKAWQVPEDFTTNPVTLCPKHKECSTLKLRPVFTWTCQDMFTFPLLELAQMVEGEDLNTAQKHKSVQGT